MRIDFSGDKASAALGVDEQQAAQGDSAESVTTQPLSSEPVDTTAFSGAAVHGSGAHSPTDVAQLTTQAMQSGVDRSSDIAALRAAVASGTYSLDPDAIADAMLG